MNNRPKILHLHHLLKDAEELLKILKELTREYEILTVHHRADYIIQLQNFKPDIIIADDQVSTITPKEAFDLIPDQEPPVPFILVSSPSNETEALELLKAGACDYILNDKPGRLPFVIHHQMEKLRTAAVIEQAVRAKKRLYEQNLAGVYTTSLKGKILACNSAFAAILGYDDPENLINQQTTKLYLYPEARRDIIRKLRDNKKLLNYETTLVKKDGKPVHLVVNTNLFYDPLLGEEICEGVVIDITERKISEDQILQSKANLRTLFNHTDTAHVLINGKLEIISYNLPAKKFTELHGYGKPVIGKKILDYFPPEKKQGIADVIQLVLAGENITSHVTTSDLDGVEYWYSTKWASVANEENKNWGFLLSITDITTSKISAMALAEINAELVKRNKSLEQFTYIISHNLRAPVANIISLTELLKDINQGTAHLEIIEGLNTSIKTMDTVISDLNYTLQVKKQLHMKTEKVYFRQLMEEITFSINNMIISENVKISYDFEVMPSVVTLRGYLYSIFYNLILNSIKYRRISESPVIHVKCTIEDSNLLLTFEDNGKGIDMEKHGQQLFGLYNRFDTTIEGKGMGLFMVKTQVEELHGNIEVHSELDKGMKVFIRLPVGD